MKYSTWRSLPSALVITINMQSMMVMTLMVMTASRYLLLIASSGHTTLPDNITIQLAPCTTSTKHFKLHAKVPLVAWYLKTAMTSENIRRQKRKVITILFQKVTSTTFTNTISRQRILITPRINQNDPTNCPIVITSFCRWRDDGNDFCPWGPYFGPSDLWNYCVVICSNKNTCTVWLCSVQN